eukprot:TRINITY_DN44139_c0_g1_i1.p1 TRINITY_DN44139_c0_g1~~TRINITY_DN44139_c0_g1_i1.p1  ORF type:complete len:177 (+),score=40.00 TRINITY_DN44139_c0_g1_i1:65-595(+)
MQKSRSSPAMAKDDNMAVEVGDAFIQKNISKAKKKMEKYRDELDGSMRHSRQLFFAGASTTGEKLPLMWVEPNKNDKKTDFTKPKYVGQQATELNKWLNAEGITRVQEETNMGVPTVRQVLRVDDRIDLEQLTKRTSALPGDALDGEEKKLKRDQKAKLRHLESYLKKASTKSEGR